MEPGPATATASGKPDPLAVGARVAALFEAHGRMVHALCRLLLREREEAEDATQQTFLLAHRSLLGGVVPEQPEAWLATIARNESYRRLSRRGPEALPLHESDGGGSGDPAGLADQRAEIEALCQALAELPPAQRQAVVLREFYGLSYREVAAALGVSGPAVESLLFKSRRRLQDKLRPVRAASNALILPLTVRDALAEAIPGFSGGAGAAAGGALLAKVGAAPLAAKLAAVVVAAGSGVGVTVAELRHAPAASRASQPAVVDPKETVEPPQAPAGPRGQVERPVGIAYTREDDDERDDDEERDDEERDDEERDDEEAEGEEERRTTAAEAEQDHEADEGEEDEPEEAGAEPSEEWEADEESDGPDEESEDD